MCGAFLHQPLSAIELLKIANENVFFLLEGENAIHFLILWSLGFSVRKICEKTCLFCKFCIVHFGKHYAVNICISTCKLNYGKILYKEEEKEEEEEEEKEGKIGGKESRSNS